MWMKKMMIMTMILMVMTLMIMIVIIMIMLTMMFMTMMMMLLLMMMMIMMRGGNALIFTGRVATSKTGNTSSQSVSGTVARSSAMTAVSTRL